MNLSRRAILHLAAATAALPATAQLARAQAYPSRPITLIVPFAAGGPNDILGRLMAEHMRASLGQPVIVENVGGANGSLGIGRLARAGGDGYTIGIGTWATQVINPAIYPLTYDTVRDLEPVALLATSAPVFVGNNDLPASNLTELVAWLKANPDKATLGTVGAGSPPHVAGVFFQNLTGTRFRFVPYRGMAPAMQDLMAGQIALSIDSPITSLPLARAGKIKAFGVLAASRFASAPDIPTTDEAGLPGFHLTVWNALWATRGTPREAIARINGAVVAALADPAVRKRFAELGQDIPTRDRQTPEALGALQKADIDKWWPIVKAANIKGE